MTDNVTIAIGVAVVIAVLSNIGGRGSAGAKIERAGQIISTVLVLGLGGLVLLGLWVAAELAKYGYDVFALANGGGR